MILDIKNLTVGELMQKDVVTVFDDQAVFDASVLMTSRNVGILPVIKRNGILVGAITDRDIVSRCNSYKKDVCKTKVTECMTANPCRSVPSMSCTEAMSLMSRYGVRRLIIVKNDKLVGIISTSDIAKVYDFCPNKKCPKDDCILIDVAKGVQRTSHIYLDEVTSEMPACSWKRSTAV